MRLIKFLIFIMLFNFMTASASAGEVIDTKTPIDIMVNGKYIKTDVRPFIVSGSTYVPIRFVSEALCVDEVIWDSDNNAAVIKDKNTEIVLPIGKDYAFINGKYVKITNGVRLMNDRTFVPVRFIAENLGANVQWDSSYFIVTINKQGIDVPATSIYEINYTCDDLYWLSRIISAEAEGEPLDGKIGVGDVVLNRLKSPDFPDTVHDVIFDENFGIQFQPVANGRIYSTPTYESTVAAKYALEGKNVVGESLYFLNLDIATSSWIPNNRTLYMQIGNHTFYL